jgi:hypothetical protein
VNNPTAAAALLLAISEVHSGSRGEGERIVAAVLDAIRTGKVPGISMKPAILEWVE